MVRLDVVAARLPVRGMNADLVRLVDEAEAILLDFDGPVCSIFAGYPSDRMFERWRPTGDGPVRVVKVQPGIDHWDEVVAALDEIRSLA